MRFSPALASSITHTQMRNPKHVADISGMCAVCTADCIGPCEIGLSAIRGAEAILPYSADKNQFASEKRYPLDFSHFNINGRMFGAVGLAPDPEEACFPNADISSTFGRTHAVPIMGPFILPAMAKLAWREYFAGAALSGVPVVIGEDVIAKDPGLVADGYRVAASPLIAEMVSTFRRYQREFGDIVLQANFDDEYHGVLEYAIDRLGVKSVELKFGQAAKGIQGMSRVPDIADALRFKALGYIVLPDPTDPVVAEAHAKGLGPVFEKIGKLPMWTPEMLLKRVAQLRRLGAERICFKMGPFDPRDIATILRVASEAGVDLVTFDGAGGGTGHSPAKMMNEWGMPTVTLEVVVRRILEDLAKAEKPLPPVAMAGGFATEDQIYKGLALGAPYIRMIAIGRAAMAAASVGRQVGEALRNGTIPKAYAHFGSTVDEIFADFRLLKTVYGGEAADIPTGAIGLYSYLNRVCVGLKQFMALNRKFALRYIGREDIVPLTDHAARVTGLATYDARIHAGASAQLKVAALADIDDTLALHYRYQIDSIADEDKKDGFVTTPFTREELADLINKEKGLFIARKDERVVAYVMAASWGFWSKWPMFAFMIKDLPGLSYRGQTLSTENSYQYGPVCIDKSVRGTGILEQIFNYAKEKMSNRFPILVTFVNKTNGRSYAAHTRKLGLDVIHEFEFNHNRYYEMACLTNQAAHTALRTKQ